MIATGQQTQRVRGSDYGRIAEYPRRHIFKRQEMGRISDGFGDVKRILTPLAKIFGKH